MLSSVLLSACVAFLYSGVKLLSAVEILDNYMDKVIKEYLKPEIQKRDLDPWSTPAFNVTFPDRFLRIKVNVKTDYSRGRLEGLSTVKNLHNCSGPIETFGNSLVSCHLGFSDLDMHYDTKVKYGVMPKFSVSASSKIRGTVIAVDIASSPNKNTSELHRFDVREIGVITPKYTGLGPLNRYLDMLTDSFLRTATNELMRVLNHQFKEAVSDSVSKVPLTKI